MRKRYMAVAAALIVISISFILFWLPSSKREANKNITPTPANQVKISPTPDYKKEIEEAMNKKITLGKVFPGRVPDSGERVKEKPMEVNFKYSDLSYLRMLVPPGNWQSTGLYAPPGEEIIVEVAEGMPKLDIQIGAHTDDLFRTDPKKLLRAAAITLRDDLKPGTNKIMNPYGGLIYFIPTGASVDTKAIVRVSGAVMAPYFVLGQTTDEEWNTIKNYPAPWAELQSSRIILTVPSEDIKNMDNPAALMKKWDEIANEYDKFSGLSPDNPLPHKSPDRPQRFVADIQISAGYMHAGYPIMYPKGSESKNILNIETIQHNSWGFWHELGHNYQQTAWDWGAVSEVTNNIYSIYIQTLYGNKSRLVTDKTDKGLIRYDSALKYVNNNDPNKNYNDDSQLDVFERLVMFSQLQQAYGWEFFAKLSALYRETPKDKLPRNQDEQISDFVINCSKVSGNNLLEFFDKWGLKYSDYAKKNTQGMKLPKPKQKIWELKLEY